MAALPADIGEAGDPTDPEGHIWRRSTRCGQHGSCVEVTDLVGGLVGVRDGKIPETSPVLAFEREAWLAFVAAIKAGEFS